MTTPITAELDAVEDALKLAIKVKHISVLRQNLTGRVSPDCPFNKALTSLATIRQQVERMQGVIKDIASGNNCLSYSGAGVQLSRACQVHADIIALCNAAPGGRDGGENIRN